MLSFGQAIGMNQSEEPDWIITIDGQDVGEFVQEWQLKDAEQGMSELTVTLANPEKRNSGRWKYGQELKIRFGFRGQLSEPAHLLVGRVQERYPTGELSIVVTGRDESSQMGGGYNKGNHKGGSGIDVCKREYEARGFQFTQGAIGGSPEYKSAPVMNMNSAQTIHQYGKSVEPAGSGGGGTGPASPLAGEKKSNAEGTDQKRDKGFTFSSAEGFGGERTGADANRAANNCNSAGSEPVTGTLDLKGFPTLRGKKTVQVLGVGQEASGTYYVKAVTHAWKPGQGYRTRAELIRGGTGSGGAGGGQPMVTYADIWQQGMMFMGTRAVDGEPQATFTYGEGKHLIGFELDVHPQPQRHGGEPNEGEGEGLDQMKKFEPYVVKAMSGEGESEGQKEGGGQ